MKKLLILVVLLVVSACGIKPTGVVPAGPAPTLRNPGVSGRGADVILYFVIGGRVAPVSRSTGTVGVENALSLLLAGPTPDEADDGYGTDLPRRSGPIVLSPGSPPAITVPFPLKPISGAGINQLVCTAFAALAAQGGYSTDGVISLSGTDVRLPYQACQAF
ncbi:hypothetical protein AB0M83_01960 [Amycolatopsis sp. NPDC051106]|uniref:hypothetical protein n=1 Tax=unclassified Amycolatopsis TaxID=2618356 RepID=UPI003418D9B0